MKKKSILISLILLVILGILSIVYYYYYENNTYVTTEDARINATLASVTPQISGKITTWNVSEGEYVDAGATLGWQDTQAVSNSAAINVNALSQVGSVTISKTEIIAPITGRIIKSLAQQGQIASPGQQLAIIANTSDIYVSANIEETKIKKLKPGQKVDVTVDALNNQKYMGIVEEIGYATVSSFALIPVQSSGGSFTKVTQLIPVKIRFPEASRLNLAPGMSVTVKIHLH
jgi:multidrug resistance efflux pump